MPTETEIMDVVQQALAQAFGATLGPAPQRRFKNQCDLTVVLPDGRYVHIVFAVSVIPK